MDLKNMNIDTLKELKAILSWADKPSKELSVIISNISKEIVFKLN